MVCGRKIPKWRTGLWHGKKIIFLIIIKKQIYSGIAVVLSHETWVGERQNCHGNGESTEESPTEKFNCDTERACKGCRMTNKPKYQFSRSLEQLGQKEGREAVELILKKEADRRHLG